MVCLGAHMSVSGGLEKAIASALEFQMDTVQIFTKNNNQWAAKPLTELQIGSWKQAWGESELRSPISHASYLINLAAPDDGLWQKSIDALIIELDRCEQLDLTGLVLHPGAFTTSSAEAGVARVIAGVQKAYASVPFRNTRLLLENTAGQGSCLGWSMEQLGELIRGINQHDRTGICIDTCHAFAAGYDLTQANGMKQLVKEIKKEFPKHSLAAIHLNDSKCVCGKRVDRHEHIGRGHIGDDGFRRFFGESLFRDLPMYLETPKEVDDASGEHWDAINMRHARTLASKPT